MSFLGKLANLSVASFLKKCSKYLGEIKNKDKYHPKQYKWEWDKKGYNRISLVNHLISLSGGISSKYLEIGCYNNTLFDSVASLKKTGVDPSKGGTHRMTSDDFFSINKEIFDVIFIDGLHEYFQVYNDAINALKAIKVGGYIAFHDFLPGNWKEEHVPRISSHWNGDCWKLASQLCESKGLEFFILNIDQGVGVLKKLSDDWYIPRFSEELNSSDFAKYVSVVDDFPIISFEDWTKINANKL